VLISSGVRLPAGKWVRVLGGNVPRQDVEKMLANVFPELKGKALTFATLAGEDDVQEFEKLFAPPS
jgi:hypothetical protein